MKRDESWFICSSSRKVIVFFSTTFTLRYQTKHKRDYLVTAICSISLIIALLTASLLPTDVILVSFMKYRNGTFKVRLNENIIVFQFETIDVLFILFFSFCLT